MCIRDRFSNKASLPCLTLSRADGQRVGVLIRRPQVLLLEGWCHCVGWEKLMSRGRGSCSLSSTTSSSRRQCDGGGRSGLFSNCDSFYQLCQLSALPASILGLSEQTKTGATRGRGRQSRRKPMPQAGLAGAGTSIMWCFLKSSNTSAMLQTLDLLTQPYPSSPWLFINDNPKIQKYQTDWQKPNVNYGSLHKICNSISRPSRPPLSAWPVNHENWQHLELSRISTISLATLLLLVKSNRNKTMQNI